MHENKFDPEKLQKLNDPQRLIDIPPDYIWSRLGIAKPDVMVEIGAGTAFFCLAFLRYAEAATIYACDVSEKMIQWVEENICPTHPNIITLKSGETTVPLADGIADLVYMINLHHELDAPDMTVREAFRLLKPGGAVFVVDWKRKDMPQGPPLTIRYVPEAVRGQLKRGGFGRVAVFEELPKHFLVVAKKVAGA
jgi:ubiquinone/menaquinone biosynthesis C-methylase UbiE